MKYHISTVSLVLLLAGCSSGTKYVEDGAATSSDSTAAQGGEMAVSSGIDGVYSGGSWEPTGSNVSEVYDASGQMASGGTYSPGPAPTFNAASNSDQYDNPNYGKNVVAGPSASAKDRIIYFGYDSSSIDSRAQSIVQQHAAYLKANPSAKVLLEGHTDNRGSRSYNVGLGERRAISVMKRFKALGVAVSQMRIISYGEENLAAQSGSGENAHKRNRRVVVQY